MPTLSDVISLLHFSTHALLGGVLVYSRQMNIKNVQFWGENLQILVENCKIFVNHFTKTFTRKTLTPVFRFSFIFVDNQYQIINLSKTMVYLDTNYFADWQISYIAHNICKQL